MLRVSRLFRQHPCSGLLPCRSLSLGAVRASNKFSDLSLETTLVDNLRNNGFEEMFEIQQKTIPVALDGKDFVGRAQTGSGKTLSFAIPVINKLLQSEAHRREPRALMVFPTRELCVQTTGVIQTLAPRFRVASVYGGVPQHRQSRALHRGCDILLGTPGRLCAWVNEGRISVDKLEFLVLDEADELLRPEFFDQMRDMIRLSPSTRQTLLFSATFSREAKSIADEFMKNPDVIDLTTEKRTPSSVRQMVMTIEEGREIGSIIHTIESLDAQRVLLFVSTKRATRNVASYLSRVGINCAGISGDLEQSTRERIFRDFKSGRTKVLVATDVAARGLDVPECDLVIQCEPPPSGVDSYIHRSGRTGRAGRSGTSVLLLYSHQSSFLRELRSEVPKLETMQAPAAKFDADKPWLGVLNEDFGFGRGFMKTGRQGGGRGFGGGFGGRDRGFGGGFGGGRDRGFGGGFGGRDRGFGSGFGGGRDRGFGGDRYGGDSGFGGSSDGGYGRSRYSSRDRGFGGGSDFGDGSREGGVSGRGYSGGYGGRNRGGFGAEQSNNDDFW